MALSEMTVRRVKPIGKDYTMCDGNGLSLNIRSKGGKAWQFRFYWQGKQRRFFLGSYPEVSLKEARILRDEARAALAKGHNPLDRQPRKKRVELSFLAVYQEWFSFKKLSLSSERQSTAEQIERIFNNDVLPHLKHYLITEITRKDLLGTLRPIERCKALTTAEKCRTWFKQLFRFALVKYDLATNPAIDLDVVALPVVVNN